MMIRRFLLVALALLLHYAPADAQSVFATRGLGVPILPADARSMSLGGITTGLFGLNPSLDNVAETGGLVRRGISASFQPSSRAFEIDGASDNLSSTRFPLIHAFYPARPRIVVSLGYGAFLDQGWGLTTDQRVLLGTDSVTTRDVARSTGGIAQMKLGAAFMVRPGLWIGAGGGLYTGSVEREVERLFPDSGQSDLRSFTTRTRWTYLAPLATFGVRFDIGAIGRVGAGVTWAGKLDAEGQDSAAIDRSYDLPLQGHFGMSALLAPGLLASVNAQYAGWDVATDDFRSNGIVGNAEASTTARNTWSFGGGLEYALRTSDTRSVPFRFGARRTQFPFYLANEDPVNETALSFGLGYRIAGDDENPLATFDVGVERGDRTGGPTVSAPSESFWRATVSVSLFGR
jgi:hypothetical protein